MEGRLGDKGDDVVIVLLYPRISHTGSFVRFACPAASNHRLLRILKNAYNKDASSD